VYVLVQAIDLVDEAAAKLNIEVTSKPTVIDEVDRRLIQVHYTTQH
jgi:ATP-dependent Clp protease ATP-binding subunit ClpB